MSKSKYKELQERFYGLPVPAHLKHGTTYVRGIYGCDCRICLPSGRRSRVNGRSLTRAERSARLRESKRGKPVPPTVKHGVYAYRVYACPCDTCRTAILQSKRRRERNARLRRRRGEWIDRDDGVTVVHWPKEVSCPICTAESAQAA